MISATMATISSRRLQSIHIKTWTRLRARFLGFRSQIPRRRIRRSSLHPLEVNHRLEVEDLGAVEAKPVVVSTVVANPHVANPSVANLLEANPLEASPFMVEVVPLIPLPAPPVDIMAMAATIIPTPVLLHKPLLGPVAQMILEAQTPVPAVAHLPVSHPRLVTSAVLEDQLAKPVPVQSKLTTPS
ncbi:uncharacterized protein BKA78DRAFT_311649 [Phyllosticta capitalensis]|uniref:uncharacterized protein n=1 Tax=Phyllosticta capitalensis TaxID=121624 RepID=UPI00312EEB57